VKWIYKCLENVMIKQWDILNRYIKLHCEEQTDWNVRGLVVTVHFDKIVQYQEKRLIK
jgi:hypothetical protein